MVTTLTISGMRGVHCTRAVFTALTDVPGITRADITVGRAVVEHDGRASVEALRQAMALAGYVITAVKENRRTLPQLP
jgi:copper chaperone CopZ